MFRLFILTIVLSLYIQSNSMILPHIGAAIGTKPKEYTVDLDAAPYDKWREIITDHKE